MQKKLQKSSQQKNLFSFVELVNNFFGKVTNKSHLLDVFNSAQKRNILSLSEYSMIEKIINMDSMRVRDLMIPRGKVYSITENDELSEVFDIIKKSLHSRYPLYAEDNERVIGIVLVKDLFIASLEKKAITMSEIKHIARKPLFVAESMRLIYLLEKFQVTRQHMAIVVDEFDSVAGIITIENVIESIMGEIDDEYNTYDLNMITHISENSFLIRANIGLDELKEEIGLGIDEEYIETIGGFLAKKLGNVPKVGEEVSFKEKMTGSNDIYKWTFRVIKGNNRKISLVKAKRKLIVNEVEDLDNKDY